MIKRNIKNILTVLKRNLGGVFEKEVKELIEKINQSKRIFIVGAGRSGLVGKAFGMRLMHLALQVYVVGETITPAIKGDDLLIAISGSGETRSVIGSAGAAKSKKAAIAVITGNPNSILGKMADIAVKIPPVIKRKELLMKDYEARQLINDFVPLGTAFELSAFVLCEAIVAELRKIKKVSEQEMKKRHTDLE